MGSFIAWSFIVTAGFVLFYLALVSLETQYNNRVASDFRLYLDQKLIKFSRKLLPHVKMVGAVYERGADAVEEDLIEPITGPFSKIKQQYHTMKVGESAITQVSVSETSDYLQKLLKDKRER